MLGLGLGLNKSTPFKKYALDYIPGGVESNVLWLSYYQITGRRNDECFRLRDLTTSDEWDIGRVDGYVDYNRVLSLLSGHTGKAVKIYNNSWAIGAQDSIQTSVANMPVVAEAGVFHHNGFKFVSASSNYMSVVDYAGIQIINPPLSYYANYTVLLNSLGGYILAKRDATTRQYSLGSYDNLVKAWVLDSTDRAINQNVNALNKTMCVWQDKNANGFKMINDIDTGQTTVGSALTNYNELIIGARPSGAYAYDGYIKTISISADNLYDYYNVLAARC